MFDGDNNILNVFITIFLITFSNVQYFWFVFAFAYRLRRTTINTIAIAF